ncbi:MAG: AAA family ATPase [bacterium]|nr:AAA family ATPase [bacterium]
MFKKLPSTSPTITLKQVQLEKKIWAVAGGKGGTGKTMITSNLGVGLAILGYKVILIDGDLGGADLHLSFGMPVPKRNLNDFLAGRVSSLHDVLLPTQNANLSLICGGSELIGLANLPYQRKEKLKRHINQLDADFILVDLGAGTAYNTLDFFVISNEGFIICNPEPQAKIDAYSFVKNAVYRRFLQTFARNTLLKDLIINFGNNGQRALKIRDLVNRIGDAVPDYGDKAQEIVDTFRPKLIMNKVRKKRQLEDADRFCYLVREYLSVHMQYLGHIEYDEGVVDACEKMRPFLLDQPTSKVSLNIYNTLFNMGIQDRQLRYDRKTYKKMAKGVKLESKLWKE